MSKFHLGKVNSAFMLNLLHSPELILWYLPTTGNNCFEFSCVFFLSPPALFHAMNELPTGIKSLELFM